MDLKNISWKTTLAGILAIVGVAVSQFAPQYSDVLNTVSTILVGLGLVSARDNNKSSEDVGVNK